MTHLTEKEYFNAKENVKQIENYIKQEILPYFYHILTERLKYHLGRKQTDLAKNV